MFLLERTLLSQMYTLSITRDKLPVDIDVFHMSLSTNKALVKSFAKEVFNNQDISAIEKYLVGQGKDSNNS